ncbi:WYL domain-containing protein [Oscillochloris sp. ZM17-4]|uniref:helix-turn-helix transcriptional regulator n=1 Tax=Oscillochloris sp. ZM17-4 TaxID=2866714 RepID=UPI001C73624B|nr:WYL domain-containing protein [Oscillochloris sp. ZM17-4]MBX0326133.1 WYL domain-containing protein [Oscillochloris sp. ZM17-4]
MPTPLSPHSTALIIRLRALLDALRDGPLAYPDLIARLGATYPSPASARRMIARDIEHLAALGVTVQRSDETPTTYTLRGGAPAYGDDDLLTLAVLRDSVGPNHPYARQVAGLLARLTAALGDAQRAAYDAQRAGGAPVQPAIDYGPHAARIAELERAIAGRQLLRLRYRNSRGDETTHRMVEPHAIEYYDRHFYLVAYSHNSGQVHDLRVDRILAAGALRSLPPGMAHTRRPITFRYRLAAALAQGELSQRFAAQRVVERLPGGDVIIEAEGRSDFFIIQALLRYRSNAELLGPPELRARMAEEVRRLTELYNDNG